MSPFWCLHGGHVAWNAKEWPSRLFRKFFIPGVLHFDFWWLFEAILWFILINYEWMEMLRHVSKYWRSVAVKLFWNYPYWNYTLRQLRSYHHRMACVERDLKSHLITTPVLSDRVDLTRPSCLGLHPAGPWILPVMGHRTSTAPFRKKMQRDIFTPTIALCLSNAVFNVLDGFQDQTGMSMLLGSLCLCYLGLWCGEWSDGQRDWKNLHSLAPRQVFWFSMSRINIWQLKLKKKKITNEIIKLYIYTFNWSVCSCSAQFIISLAKKNKFILIKNQICIICGNQIHQTWKKTSRQSNALLKTVEFPTVL